MAGQQSSPSLPSPDLIQDITTRFILTAPAEQLMFFESIMFLVEQAHWYYEDYVRDQNGSLKSLSLKDFAVMVFENCEELSQHLADIEQIMEHFKAFKKNVPVMGGILLDRDMQRVLLVKGWKNTACWGFPRGKIHKNETDAQCAVREVLEETGYDIEDLVNEEDFIELTLDGKRNKLFIVAGLDPDSAQFAPKCKGEIGGYAWHRIADLPATRDEGNQTFLSEDGTRHKFFMVWPYLKPLRKWIKKKQRDQPDWDMPAPSTTPELHRTRSNAGSTNGLLMLSPLPPKVQQQLSGSEQQRRSGTGSPKHMQHMQFHEAAIAQSRQQGTSGSGTKPAPGAGVIQGPLAALFAGAAAAAGAAVVAAAAAPNGSDSNIATACRGFRVNGSSETLATPRSFRFNKRAILHALSEPSAIAAGGPQRARLGSH